MCNCTAFMTLDCEITENCPRPEKMSGPQKKQSFILWKKEWERSTTYHTASRHSQWNALDSADSTYSPMPSRYVAITEESVAAVIIIPQPFCSLYHLWFLLSVEELFTCSWLSAPQGFITLHIMLHVTLKKQKFNERKGLCIVLLQLCLYWLCNSDIRLFVQFWIPYMLENIYI